ncbi:hypothetical protein [Virgisporangium aurantiacum]|uniref:Uncharacterized protein n=1 Tax=Virgisporangium aurantiacum TaxID=175570 RepID=A0A8J4E1F5_9ACTN|nr:hypothetical protein [Virgisporangium aurantiacum]GIJ57806.1 hypothetical protein Vau01_053220 [Virgisporangium aurantiacum]
MTTMTHPDPHSPEWWDGLLHYCGDFDSAVATERLAELILPRIPQRMLRREADLALTRVVSSLIRPTPELQAAALKVTERLETLLIKRRDLGQDDEPGVRESRAICHLMRQRYGAAAADAEASVGMDKLLHAIFASLRSSTLHTAFTIELLKRGQDPEQAVRAGRALGTYRWWPDWLRSVATDLALQGRLDSEIITSLDRSAFAELNVLQARMARKLIDGDTELAGVAASRLVSIGKPDVAAALLRGDLEAIAMASKLTLNVAETSRLRG